MFQTSPVFGVKLQVMHLNKDIVGNTDLSLFVSQGAIRRLAFGGCPGGTAYHDACF